MLPAQLTDLHVGAARNDEALLNAVIAEVNEASPDMVVIAGDVTDSGTASTPRTRPFPRPAYN